MRASQIIGHNIRQQRKIRLLTQRELAVALGFTNRYIEQVEQGVRCPSMDKLVKICEWFGITLDDILPIEEQRHIEEKDRRINEIVDVLNFLELTQIGAVKTIVSSMRG